MTRPSDELLSAYHDGEATADEQELLTGFLSGADADTAEGRAAQETLDAYVGLSDAVRASLPTSAPDGFAAGVMSALPVLGDSEIVGDKAVENEAPETDPASQMVANDEPSRGGLVALSAVMTVALMWLVAVMLPPVEQAADSDLASTMGADSFEVEEHTDALAFDESRPAPLLEVPAEFELDLLAKADAATEMKRLRTLAFAAALSVPMSGDGSEAAADEDFAADVETEVEGIVGGVVDGPAPNFGAEPAADPAPVPAAIPNPEPRSAPTVAGAPRIPNPVAVRSAEAPAAPFRSVHNTPMASDGGEQPPADPLVEPETAPATVAMNSKPEPPAQSEPSRYFAPGGLPESLDIPKHDLKTAHVGDVVQGLRVRDGEVAVVTLTVVDRQAGLATLQVLLAQNDIQPDPDVQVDSVASRNTPQGLSFGGAGLGGGSRAGKSDPQLYAVFVSAEPTQLASALQQIQEQSSFGEVQVEPSVEVAGLNLYSRRRGAGERPVVQEGRNLSTPGAGVKDEAKEQRVPGIARKANDAPKAESAGDAQRGGFTEKVASRETRQRVARQYSFTVPVGNLASTTKKRMSRGSTTVDVTRPQAEDRDDIDTASRPLEEADAKQRSAPSEPMQVLFVLRSPSGPSGR